MSDGNTKKISEEKPRIEIKRITDAVPDEHNANKHTPRGAAVVEKSLSERGFFRPMAAAGKGVAVPVIKAGNQTQESAINIGMDEAIFIYTDGKRPIIHVREDLDPNSKEAIQLALEDNRSAQLGLDWDIDALALVDADVLDDLGLNFEAVDYDEMWQGMPEFEQEDKSSYQSIHVHFKNAEEVAEFGALIGQSLTDKTRSIWYSQREKMLDANERYSA